jgi:hypothetical protein
MERILTGTLKNKMFSAVVLGFKHTVGTVLVKNFN